MLRVGVLTVSDRASRGVYEDRGGPAAADYFAATLASPHECVRQIIEDERPAVEAALMELAAAGCRLIVTTGGTGPTPRDVTPEVTEAVCDKLLPGFGEQMRAVSLDKVPTAILSRQTAGVLGSSLVVNLPGQPRAVAECLDAVLEASLACVKLLGGPVIKRA